MSEDERAIRALVEEWMRATEAGEIDALAELMTEEMVFITVHNEPMTKAKFLEGMRTMLPKAVIQSESDIQEVRVEGRVAWCWNNLTARFTPKGHGEVKVIRGTTLGVYLKGEDGKWRLHRDANLMA